MSFSEPNKRLLHKGGERRGGADCFDGLSVYSLIIPVILLLCVPWVLSSHDALHYDGCIALQKPLFYFINQQMLAYPMVEYNLTQLGDALIFLSFLTPLIVYRSRIWQALIPALILSGVFTPVLKSFFAMPRPAAVFDPNTFTIMGRVLVGHNSLPSGHSVTIFTILTILIVAFMPQDKLLRWLWVPVVVGVGFLVALSRVAVGAHHPLDVYVGACFGSIFGMSGIFFLRRFPIVLQWVGERRWHPFFMLLIAACVVVLFFRIIEEPLVIHFLSIFSLLLSLYVIVKDYSRR